jgi:MoaA/NifB/PqqE/SkfB family radical SAM enzyme
MKTSEVLLAWTRILAGYRPTLSIEITRECPLRCPGCYAYDAAHLSNATHPLNATDIAQERLTLRQLADFKGDELVQKILALVDRYRPIYLSLVGGDPMVRYRELEVLLPELISRGIHVQVVTSAFRQIPAEWAQLERLTLVVSVDGLQPEHDVRRKPATYDRILKNIANAKVIIHCTITGQMMKRPGYLDEFIQFWSEREQTRRIWTSFFTPQVGAEGPEILTQQERRQAIQDLERLRHLYPKLHLNHLMLREFEHPPASPKECIFAQTTHTVSADLKTKITPCQFGGNPDCSQCGCIASMGAAAVGHHKVIGGITAGELFFISQAVGDYVNRWRAGEAS